MATTTTSAYNANRLEELKRLIEGELDEELHKMEEKGIFPKRSFCRNSDGNFDNKCPYSAPYCFTGITSNGDASAQNVCSPSPDPCGGVPCSSQEKCETYYLSGEPGFRCTISDEVEDFVRFCDFCENDLGRQCETLSQGGFGCMRKSGGSRILN
uniref:Uncharacterized protein LOC100372565 n=1 Tax=Saccoglossus kowalevskii TaxID=10224 RepID=A0ABM0M0B5_SACKO|nr:PREDICTED: uncharacterized protein LOC100372565 [Saccoglossus kowalevskii]